MKTTTCLQLEAARVHLLLLALASAGLATVGVVSHFEQLPALPGMVILTLTVGKVLIFTAINLLRLCMRRSQRVRVEVNDDGIPAGVTLRRPRTKVQKRPKSVGLSSSKAREFWVELADDLLGALPAAVAVVAINSKQSPTETLFETLTATTLTVLLSVAASLKLLRVCNEAVCLVKRTLRWRLTLLMATVNLVGLLASGANFVTVLLLLLKLLEVVSSGGACFWLFPVLHIPVLQKSVKVRVAIIGESNS